MSELEDRINAVLGDPEQLGRIASMAQSLMQGAAVPEDKGSSELPDLKAVQRLFEGGGGEGSRDRRLLEAMRPYLSEKRRSRMDRALKIARLASLASLAAGLGDDGNGDV